MGTGKETIVHLLHNNLHADILKSASDVLLPTSFFEPCNIVSVELILLSRASQAFKLNSCKHSLCQLTVYPHFKKIVLWISIVFIFVLMDLFSIESVFFSFIFFDLFLSSCFILLSPLPLSFRCWSWIYLCFDIL